MDELRKKASELAGREIEFVKTSSGKWVAEWFNLNSPPPPIADTPEEAAQLFIDFLSKRVESNADELPNLVTELPKTDNQEEP